MYFRPRYEQKYAMITNQNQSALFNSNDPHRCILRYIYVTRRNPKIQKKVKLIYDGGILRLLAGYLKLGKTMQLHTSYSYIASHDNCGEEHWDATMKNWKRSSRKRSLQLLVPTVAMYMPGIQGHMIKPLLLWWFPINFICFGIKNGPTKTIWYHSFWIFRAM